MSTVLGVILLYFTVTMLIGLHFLMVWAAAVEDRESPESRKRKARRLLLTPLWPFMLLAAVPGFIRDTVTVIREVVRDASSKKTEDRGA